MTASWKKLLTTGIILVILILLPVFANVGTSIMNQIVTLFIYIVLAQSWNLIGGYTGQINLGIAAFFGCSAMVTHFIWAAGAPIYPAIVAGSLSTVLLALVIGIPTLRLKGMYFAVGTLALAQAAAIIVQNIFPKAINMPGSYVQAFDINSRYYLGLALAVIAVAAVYFISRSKLGLALVSVRDDEQAAQVTGVNTFKYKVIALLISAVLAGLAGGLYAYFRLSFYHTSTLFGNDWSFDALMAAVIGGAGTIVGPIIGSIFLVALEYIFSLTLGQANLIVFGFLFILVVLFLPQGFMGGVEVIRSRLSRFRRGSNPEIEKNTSLPGINETALNGNVNHLVI